MTAPLFEVSVTRRENRIVKAREMCLYTNVVEIVEEI